MKRTSSIIPWKKDNLSVYNIRKLYCATLLSFFKKAQCWTCLDIRDMSYSGICYYHDQARGFHGALRKHWLLHQKLFYMLIEFNTFQKHSADSKLSTNTYLMSVAAVFQIKLEWIRFNIVRSWTLFTLGYPNLMLSLLQYISFYFNINIATFVGFQIAVYAYVVLRTFTYPSSPS